MAQRKIHCTDAESAAKEQTDVQPKPKFLTLHERTSRRHSNAYRLVKRIFDVVSSTCLLAIIWPVFLVIALAIKIDSKGPVIYKHKRIGQGGKVLHLYKFRSMVPNAEAMIAQFTPKQRQEWQQNFKLVNDPRITRVGRLLRKTSLDELPQLFNILGGSLSVVGPRPVISEELEKYGKRKREFLSAKPGLTGYWQAYSRSDCDYDKRMEMELYYVENASFWWDVKIIWATVKIVLTGKGAI